MSSLPRTNAIRILDAHHADYEVLRYDAGDGVIDAVGVAQKLGLDPECLYKTLVARGSGGLAAGRIFVFCIPGPYELDPDRAAEACGAGSVALVRVDELLSLTGYIRGGCSPFAMTRPYPLFVERAATLCTRITISAGRIGVQISLAPETLIQLTGGHYADLV